MKSEKAGGDARPAGAQFDLFHGNTMPLLKTGTEISANSRLEGKES